MGKGLHVQEEVLCIKKRPGLSPAFLFVVTRWLPHGSCEKWPKSARLWGLFCPEGVIYEKHDYVNKKTLLVSKKAIDSLVFLR